MTKNVKIAIIAAIAVLVVAALLVFIFTRGSSVDTQDGNAANNNNNASDIVIQPMPEGTTEIFVSANDGNDNNAGTREAPFATIERAVIALGGLALNTEADIFIYIREGNYYVSETIEFTVAHAGRDGNTIHIIGYPGDAMPRIIGGERLSGWEYHRDGIYRIPMPRPINRLYENQDAAHIARFPNYEAGMGNGPFLRTANERAENPQFMFYFYDGDFPQFDFSRTPAQMYVLPAGDLDWKGDDRRLDSYVMITELTDVDWNNNLVTTVPVLRPEQDRDFVLSYGATYFLQGAYEFLDAPGEFFVCNQTNMLYYMPINTGTPIEQLEIIAPTVNVLLSFSGTSNISISGVQLEVTDRAPIIPQFQTGPFIPQGGLIAISSSNNISVDRSNLFNAGESTVLLNGSGSHDLSFTNSYVNNSGYTAFNLRSGGNREITIRNNLITNVGLISSYTYAFGNWGNAHVSFEHNEIDNIRGQAAFMFDGNGGGHHNVSFSFNRINNALQFGYDLGVIYAYSVAGQFNVIRDNWVTNSGTHLGPTAHINHAIYLDDNANNFLVVNNILVDTTSGNMHFPIYAKGQNNVIYNNIIFQRERLNPGTLAGIVTYDMDHPHFAPVRNVTLARNIFYLPGADFFYAIWGWDGVWQDDTFAFSDYNVFYHPDGRYYFLDTHVPIEANYEHWRVFGGRNYDVFSTFGENPMFVDPLNGDFSLHPDSPALALGFVPINQSIIGRYDPDGPPPVRDFLPPMPEKPRYEGMIILPPAGMGGETFIVGGMDDFPIGNFHNRHSDTQIVWWTDGFNTPAHGLPFAVVRQAQTLVFEFDRVPDGQIDFIWVGNGWDYEGRGLDGWWHGWNQTNNVSMGMQGTRLVINLADMVLWNEAVTGTGMRFYLSIHGNHNWDDVRITNAYFTFAGYSGGGMFTPPPPVPTPTPTPEPTPPPTVDLTGTRFDIGGGYFLRHSHTQLAWWTDGWESPNHGLPFEAIRRAHTIVFEFNRQPNGNIDFIWVGDGWDYQGRGLDGWWHGWNQTNNVSEGLTSARLEIPVSSLTLWNEAITGTGLRFLLGLHGDDNWDSLVIENVYLLFD